MSEGQISEPTTAQYRTVPLRPYNVTFDPLSIGLVEQIVILHLHIKKKHFCELVIIYVCHDYFKQVLTTSPFGGEVPQMFLSLTATRFFGSHDSCHDFLDYANYAHFAMNSYNNDVKTITPDLNSL